MADAAAPQPLPSFSWRRGKDLRFGVRDVRTAVINGKVCISGRCSDKADERTIQVYTPESDEWTTLPECPVKPRLLAAVNQQLVVVYVGVFGGEDDVGTTLHVWDSASQSWTSPYPEISSDAKYVSTAFGYKQYLVVIGPGDDGDDLSKDSRVKILDSSTKALFDGPSLPTQGAFSPAIVGDTLYVFDVPSPGTIMLSIDLTALISCASSTSKGLRPSWVQNQFEFEIFTAVGFNGSLLSVGGIDAAENVSSDVLRYDPQTKKWNKIGDLLDPVYYCGCCVLPSGELVVVGGVDKRWSISQAVQIAMVV